MKGTVTKITNFGVFVELENELEGLLHISELSDHKVENAQEVVEQGDLVEVKVIKVDTDERKIGLSLRRAIQEGAAPPKKGPLSGKMPPAPIVELDEHGNVKGVPSKDEAP